MSKKKTPQVSISAFGLGCLDDRNAHVTAETFQAISKACLRAAIAVEKNQHGTIVVKDEDGDNVFEIDIDNGGVFDIKKWLPSLALYKAKDF